MMLGRPPPWAALPTPCPGPEPRCPQCPGLRGVLSKASSLRAGLQAVEYQLVVLRNTRVCNRYHCQDRAHAHPQNSTRAFPVRPPPPPRQLQILSLPAVVPFPECSVSGSHSLCSFHLILTWRVEHIGGAPCCRRVDSWCECAPCGLPFLGVGVVPRFWWDRDFIL